MKRMIAVFALLGAITASAFSVNVVASTAWTAAFARLAGADSVSMIAPAEMTHPAEYEVTPRDILRVKSADFFVFAGYEGMMATITSSAGLTDSQRIKITTQNDWATVESQVLLIASRLGTTAKAQENLAALKIVYDAGKKALLDAGFAGKKFLVHAFQVPVIKMLGFTIVGVFGPAPLSPQQIADLSATGADVIIDNIHNPVATPLSQLLPEAKYAAFLNFPGLKGTLGIGEVFSNNVNQLK